MRNLSDKVPVVYRFAQAVSFLLHPMLMPVYVLFLIFNVGSWFVLIPVAVKCYCYFVTLLSLVVMPLACLPLLRYLHLIKDYALEDKQERIYPVLVVVVFAFLGCWVLGRVAYTDVVQRLYLVLIVLLSLFSVITLKWKISMHMTSIGGVCGFLLALGLKYGGDVRFIFICMLLLSGLLASCRLGLKKHTPGQVYLGFLLGVLSVTIMI